MKGISVIIPTYNRQNYIKEAIQSVIDQEYDGNPEIIISDDGSTDGTMEIAKSFGKRVVILNKGLDCLSQGAASTRNRGLKIATQPYICFLDSDDFYLPDHLNRIATVLESNPNSGYAFCRSLEVKEENGLKLFKRWTKQHITKKDISNPYINGDSVVLTNCFLFRRNIFDEVGGFNEAYPKGEDRDMWMRIFEKYLGAFADHYGSVYRLNHGDIQLTNDSKKIDEKSIFTIYKNAIDRYYKLELNDSRWIFELKLGLSIIKYKNYRLLHYLNYLNLIFRYPLPFLQKIPSVYSRFLEKKETNNWYELSHFLKRKI